MMRRSVSSVVRRKFERALWVVPLAFSLLLARAVIALGAPVGAAELVYLSGQALRVGACVGGVLCLLAWLDERMRGPRAVAVGVGLLALCAPKAWHAAQYLSQSDAPLRRGIPTAYSLGATLVVLGSLLLQAWLYQRPAAPSRRLHASACLALFVVVALDAIIGFSQAGLVPFFYGVATLILTVMVDSQLAERTPRSVRVAGAATVALCCAGFIGLALPAYAERGRADLHRTRSSLAHLDMHLSSREPGPSLVETLKSTRGTACDVPKPSATLAGLQPHERKNLIVISIDSVRVDDAMAEVAGRPLMPELSRFMKESWTGAEAYSAYPATLMSLSSAFSGLLPSRLMIHSPAPPSIMGSALSETHERIAVLPAGNFFQRKPVEDYVVQGAQRLPGRGARAQTEQALEKLRELRSQDKPHVMWIHYLEPHEPYEHHAGFGLGQTPRERYRSELAFVDRELGRLFSALREGGWYEDSAIFVLSDHGEAFGEHGQEFHHFQVYPWLIQVPFALHLPGQAARTFAGPVSLTDLAATAFEFLSVQPSLQLDGRSLLSSPPHADRAVLSEEFPAQLHMLARYANATPPGPEEAARRARELETPRGYPSKVSVIQRGHQLILHRGTGVVELYDLARDPGALDNLAYRDRRRSAALQDALDAWFNDIAQSANCTSRALRAANP